MGWPARATKRISFDDSTIRINRQEAEHRVGLVRQPAFSFFKPISSF
jgi:hypothetical protein